MKNQSPKYQNIYIELKNFTTNFFIRRLYVFAFISGCRWVGGWARVYK